MLVFYQDTLDISTPFALSVTCGIDFYCRHFHIMDFEIFLVVDPSGRPSF